jgi:pancreatic triacylglycerol lipase
VIIHGAGQNENSPMNLLLTKSYLTRGNFNVIVVDWSTVASPLYEYARRRVNMVGMAVSKYLTWLNSNYTTLHVIGYDLGAHIAGIAGKNTIEGRIARIVALDPSLPLFNENLSVERLSSGDAQLVEVFHSNGGRLGFFSRLGQLDYYINNGRQQPECTNSYYRTCSHYRSVTVFAKLVSRDHSFLVIPCQDISEVANKCSLNPIEILLEEISPSGVYQIITVSAEPLSVESTAMSAADP